MLTKETLDRLAPVLTASQITCLQLPGCDSELMLLCCLATRYERPCMPQYNFSTVEQAIAAVLQHVADNPRTRAKHTSRSDRAIQAKLMAAGYDDMSALLINPWTYGVPTDDSL